MDEELLGAEMFEITESGVVNPVSPDFEEDPGVEPADEQDTLAEEIQGVITRGLEESENYFSDELEPDMVKATEYYHGRPFGNERDGRSKVVSPLVRDVTLAQLPSLVRVFLGPERVVEFRPRRLQDEEQAAQQTDYVNYILMEENPGFLTLMSVMKDALVRRLGVAKWWWDDTSRVEATEYTGLTAEGVQVLMQEGDVDDLEVLAIYPAGEPVMGVGGFIEPPTLHDVRITYQHKQGRARVAAVPPEEFRFTPYARDLDSAPLVAHVREVPVDELVAMGFEEDLVKEHAGKRTASGSTEELKWARQIGGQATDDDDVEGRDPSQRLVLYSEAYSLVDGDGDGVAELRLFQCIGPSFEIINGDGLGEIVDQVPFSVWTPDPEPHTLIGLANYDLVGDLQLIDSQLWRGMMDSLSEAITPTTEVVNGEVNMGDFLKPDVSKIVRVRRPGMIREVKHSFAGGDVIPVLGMTTEMRENRTGTSKAAMGLDADALQSAAKSAVAATLSGSQQRLELLAMVFAHTGFRRLFIGVRDLLIQHQTWSDVVKLRGRYTEVDPRHWDAGLGLIVNIGLGQGTPEERRAAHERILEFQKALMEAGSPLVTNVQLRAALEKYAQLLGYPSGDAYFVPWGQEQEQQLQQEKAQQPPPLDPNMELVKVEAAKAEATALVNAEKLEIERWKAEMQDDRERDRTAREMALKERELEMKYKQMIQDAELKAQVTANRSDA